MKVWLTLAPDLQVAVDYDEALKWGQEEFHAFYAEHAIYYDPDTAEKWAAQQVAMRDLFLRGEGVPRSEPLAEFVEEPQAGSVERVEVALEDLGPVDTFAWADEDWTRTRLMQMLCMHPLDKQRTLCTFPDCSCGVTGGIDVKTDNSWRLVERYNAYSPLDRVNNFRLVFRRGTQVLEIDVPKEQWDAFGA